MNYNSEEKKILRDKLSELQQKVKEILLQAPSCHDLEHTLRVRENAAKLAEIENADALLIDYAALLHDIARPQELLSQGKTCHAKLGAEMAKSILKEIKITNEQFIEKVAACVRTHRYRNRGEELPESLEAKIVFDADKLDSLGAIGLARAFHFAGRIGAKVHNSKEKAINSKSYSQEDSAYREYLVKLRYLPESMLTESGKKIATARLAFMRDFFEKLNKECSGKDLTRHFTELY